MREENFNDFDLQLRSLLQDAEVKAPRSVWRGVSARLDELAPAPAAPVGSWWKWACAGLAVAAALVAGLFVPGSRSTVVPDGPALVAEVEEPILTNQYSVAPEAAEFVSAAPVSPALPISSGTFNVPDDLVASVIPEPEAPEQAVPAQPAEVVASESPAVTVKEAPAPAAPDTYGATADLFAQMAWEDEHRKPASKPSFVLEGALGGNDSRLTTGLDHRSYMTSGTMSHTRTSISETSKSAYGVPLSFGAGVRFHLTNHFSVGTGVMYSFLNRSFTGEYFEVEDDITTRSLSGDITHKMHYLGVPLNFYFDFVNSKAIDFYAFAGGTAEYCISNKYFIQNVTFSDPVDKLQFSVGGGLGVQFKVSDHIGLYVDPGVRYYFRCDQPKSVRTDKPFMVNFEAGLRFNL